MATEVLHRMEGPLPPPPEYDRCGRCGDGTAFEWDWETESWQTLCCAWPPVDPGSWEDR